MRPKCNRLEAGVNGCATLHNSIQFCLMIPNYYMLRFKPLFMNNRHYGYIAMF